MCLPSLVCLFLVLPLSSYTNQWPEIAILFFLRKTFQCFVHQSKFRDNEANFKPESAVIYPSAVLWLSSLAWDLHSILLKVIAWWVILASHAIVQWDKTFIQHFAEKWWCWASISAKCRGGQCPNIFLILIFLTTPSGTRSMRRFNINTKLAKIWGWLQTKRDLKTRCNCVVPSAAGRKANVLFSVQRSSLLCVCVF